MTDKEIHDLAVAYAQVKLAQYQQENPKYRGTDLEIRSFLKSYYFAKIHIPEEDENIDLSTLV